VTVRGVEENVRYLRAVSKLAALRGFVPLANWYAREAGTVELVGTTEKQESTMQGRGGRRSLWAQLFGECPHE
jgi:hypothetical protein